jgi:catechol 2,3-dioxygenase-like lactoylglutathione lyase family enzyme
VSAGVAAIRLVSADAGRLATFYEQAFGFVHAGDGVQLADPFGGQARRVLRLRLGRERVEIVEFEAQGAPAIPGAPDTRFQHFALIAPSMDKAMRRLEGVSGWTPISRGGPQKLPASSGGVTAFKFRDPDGHPLELLTDTGSAAAPWRTGSAEAVGIGHTAIVVRDTAESIAFYASLGFERAGGSVNVGPEQARLDGVPEPRLEVTSLRLPQAPPPHLELLCYRHPRPLCLDTGPRDVAATRTVLAGKGRTEALADPDGHRWILADD